MRATRCYLQRGLLNGLRFEAMLVRVALLPLHTAQIMVAKVNIKIGLTKAGRGEVLQEWSVK